MTFLLERPPLSANHMGKVGEQEINGGLMKKSKKKNKESIFSTEEVDNVQVGSRDSKKPKVELSHNANASDALGDFNSDSNTGKTPEKAMIVQNDKKRKRKKDKIKVRDEEGTSSVLEAPKEAMNEQEKDTVSKSDVEVACDFEKGGKQAREEGQVKEEKKKKKRKNDDIRSVDANCNGVADGGDLLDMQANSEVIEDKKKKKKKSKEEKKEKRKNDGTGCSSEIQTNSEVIDRVESVEGKKKKKKRKECDDSGSSVISERTGGVNVNEDQTDGSDLLEMQANSEVIEDKKKKSKEEKEEKRKNDGTGCSREILTNSEVIDKVESVEGKKKKKKRKYCDDSGSSVISERTAVVNVDGEDQIGKKKKKKKKMKVGKEIVNCDTNITNEAVERCDQSLSHKKMKKVTFSDQHEVFPVPKSSSKKKRKKTVDDDDDNESGDEALIRGKRFSKEEDGILERAVLDYIEEHKLGEDGVEMVMKCRSYPELRDCWKEISKALPHRPTESVYYRAHILFERGEVRRWTQEEFDEVREFYKKHGAQWKILAGDMGKHRVHVKDAWRRIKYPNMKRGDWSQDEYQQLFDLVNLDLSMKVFQEKKRKHGMLRENIGWENISEKLATRSNALCCQKWYGQLSSPLVAQGEWADTDDYRLLIALTELDAACEEDVDWDNLVEDRSGDVCRERWNQMVRHIGYHGIKPFMEQVEVLSKRYCPEILEAREEYENRPYVD